MTRFQIYPESDFACKYNKTLYKTQYSEFLVEYEQLFDMNTGKLITIQQAPHHSTTNDESSYISVHLIKNTRQTGEKLNHNTKTVHVYKNYHS